MLCAHSRTLYLQHRSVPLNATPESPPSTNVHLAVSGDFKQKENSIGQRQTRDHSGHGHAPGKVVALPPIQAFTIPYTTLPHSNYLHLHTQATSTIGL